MKNTYLRGELYYADLGTGVGSEQNGYRPVVIIQNDIGNRHSPTTIVAAISTQIKTKANLPTHYHLKPGSGLVQPSMAVSEKKLKRDAEKERENAAICLFCVKEECSGADACFRE